jgi:hypothetical protein
MPAVFAAWRLTGMMAARRPEPEMTAALKTGQRPRKGISTFTRVAQYRDIPDFRVSDMFASGENVAVSGRFTWRSKAVGKTFTSSFSILAKVNNGKMTYCQFMEGTCASASSFRSSGSWRLKTAPANDAYNAGE